MIITDTGGERSMPEGLLVMHRALGVNLVNRIHAVNKVPFESELKRRVFC